MNILDGYRNTIAISQETTKWWALSIVSLHVAWSLNNGEFSVIQVFSSIFMFLGVWWMLGSVHHMVFFTMPLSIIYYERLTQLFLESAGELTDSTVAEAGEVRNVSPDVFTVEMGQPPRLISTGHLWPFTEDGFMVDGRIKQPPFDRKYLEKIWEGRINSDESFSLTKAYISQLTGLHRTGTRTKAIIDEIFEWLLDEGFIHENGYLTPLGERTFPTKKAVSSGVRQVYDRPQRRHDTHDTTHDEEDEDDELDENDREYE